MRAAKIQIVLLLLISLAGGGCATPWGQTAAGGLEDDPGKKSLLDPDKFSKDLQNSAKTLVGKGYNPSKAREHYTRADEQYREALVAQDEGERRRMLIAAAAEFRRAAERWPDSAMEQDALFFAGECYFFADYCPKANETYELLLKKHPNSKYLDTVESRRFSIAEYWTKKVQAEPESFWAVNAFDKGRPWRDSYGHAIRVWDKIRIDDPTGKLADDATLAAGNAHFARGRYMDADSFYTDLRKTFPSSEHQFRAHLLGVKAKLLAYQGPDYSGDCLDEAEKLIKQIRRQFPQQAAQEREFLVKAFAEVRYKKAEREWAMARYYDRRGEYGAARFYYDLVRNDYHETPFSDQAVARLEQIHGEPAVPPQRLEWLVNLFPQEEDVKPLIATADTGTTRR